MTEEKAFAILAQGKPVQLLSVADLGHAACAWHQTPKLNGAKKANKLQKWQLFLADATQPPEYARWMDEDEENKKS